MTVYRTVEFIIKHLGIVLFAYWFFWLSMPEKFTRRKCIEGCALAVVIGTGSVLTMEYIGECYVIVMILAFCILMQDHFKMRPRMTLSVTLLSFGFSYAAYHFSVILTDICLLLNSLVIANKAGSIESALRYIIAYAFITYRAIILQILLTLCQGLILLIMMRSRRLKKGIPAIVRFGMSDLGMIISVGVILIGVFQQLSLNMDSMSEGAFLAFSVFGVVCIFVLYLWCRNEIKNAYVKKMQEREIKLLEISLREKDKFNQELQVDNERLAEIIHKDNKLIPAMVMSVRTCAESMNGDSPDLSKALEAAGTLEDIYNQRSAALRDYELRGKTLVHTGITAVDAVLGYMANKAETCGVEFSANIGIDLTKMFAEVIDRSEFDTLLADLSENAIIAAKQIGCGRVEVRMTKIDSAYCVEVLDNGERFDTDVIKNMGTKRITTHADEGGSGIGLMTLFKIIRHNKASLTIEEFCEGANFSKSVRVTFDGSGLNRIVSFRANELKKSLKGGRFEIAERKITKTMAEK